jgi:hypothetical protein
MDEANLKNIENQFGQLKMMMDNGQINSDQLKAELKKLMFADENGHYWMIGSKTGKWYKYDGQEWKENDPYKLIESSYQSFQYDEHEDQAALDNTEQPQQQYQQEEEQSQIPQSSEYDQSFSEQEPVLVRKDQTVSAAAVQTENQSKISSTDAEYTECELCQAKIPLNRTYCAACESKMRSRSPYKSSPQQTAAAMPEIIIIKSISIISALLIMGVIGTIIGVIIGAIFGTFDIFGDAIYYFPAFLSDQRGKVAGGFIFGFLGGLSGFVAFSIIGSIMAGFYNFLASLVGGIKLNIHPE